jgi:uncharacterized protein (TIGR04222 family)
MERLLKSIAEMHGPQFLFAYAAATVMTVLIARWWISCRDSSRFLAAPQIPSDPDPYEIAYLRGGENEVLRVVLFRLLQDGALRVLFESETSVVKKTFMEGSSHSGLRTMEQEIAARSAGQASKEVFQDPWIKFQVAGDCSRYRDRLERERLLVTSQEKTQFTRIAAVGIILILMLGAYKLTTALATGHTNVAFLIVIALAGPAILWKTCVPRLTNRGRKYLRNLESAFGEWKQRKSEIAESQLLLLLSIFGVAVLSGTTYDYFQKMFPKGDGSCGSCGGCGDCGGCGGCGD